MNCPNCHSDRIRWISAHDVYLCFSCDDNFHNPDLNVDKKDNTCEFCAEPCGNDWCPAKEEK